VASSRRKAAQFGGFSNHPIELELFKIHAGICKNGAWDFYKHLTGFFYKNMFNFIRKLPDSREISIGKIELPKKF
jgi:hypothetical protein